MKFGRRAFLQFAAGAIGGTLLTPLPWKLAGDSAKWTQNWPWEPSPERGEITKVSSICLFCDGGCGIRARLVDGRRAILIEGNPSHPVNKGGVCALGASGLQFLYAPYRVAKPMKQTKKRGDASGFQPVSWTDALNELNGALTKLRTQGEPQGLACITGQSQNSMYTLWQQFFASYGSPNLFGMPSENDGQRLAAYSAFGRSAPIAFALERASYVISFGANLLEGWGAPGRMQSVYSLWRERSSDGEPVEVVQVEPRCSMTASKVDEWVPIKPGAEAALALGIAHVMIRDKLYDADFASNAFFGFEDWIDSQGKERQGFKNLVLANYTPEKVSELTGVEKDKILELAKSFATRKNAVAVWGKDNGIGSDPLYHELAFLALNALAGNLKSGGMVSIIPETPLGALPQVVIDAVAAEGLKKSRLDLAQSSNLPLPGNALHAFLHSLATQAAYPVGVLLIHEANPAYSLPENQLFKSAAEKVGMIVSFSSYMDETALQSDLILPNHTALERYDDVIGLPGTPYGYYAVASPILPPQMDTKHTGDVVLELAKKVDGARENLSWKSYEDYLKDRVKGLAASGKGAVADAAGKEPWKLTAGQTPQVNYKDEKDLWAKLTKGACWYDAPVDLMKSLATQSGDCELACQVLQKRGVQAENNEVYLPHYAPLALSGSEQEYPLLLMTYRMSNLAGGFLPTTPFMNKTLPDTLILGSEGFVELHPQTAGSMGLAEGDRALLKTPQGEIPVRVHLFPGAYPGVVFAPQGLGHTAYDEYIGGKGANPNNVIEVLTDPVTGLGTAWATRAQLRRV